MSSMRFGIEAVGFKELDALLSDFPGKVSRDIARKVIREAAKPIVARARKNLQASGSIRTRALYKSLGVKIKFYGRGGNTSVVAVIGPRRGLKSIADLAAKTGRRLAPTKYAHLLEFGTATAPAKPFLGPAFYGHRTGIFHDVKAGFSTEIHKEARTMARRSALAARRRYAGFGASAVRRLA